MEVICGTTALPIEDVVEKYTQMLYRVAVMKMKNVPDAEELVQETLIKLIKQIKEGNALKVMNT